jgi:hypothetical protein
MEPWAVAAGNRRQNGKYATTPTSKPKQLPSAATACGEDNMGRREVDSSSPSAGSPGWTPTRRWARASSALLGFDTTDDTELDGTSIPATPATSSSERAW